MAAVKGQTPASCGSGGARRIPAGLPVPAQPLMESHSRGRVGVVGAVRRHREVCRAIGDESGRAGFSRNRPSAPAHLGEFGRVKLCWRPPLWLYARVPHRLSGSAVALANNLRCDAWDWSVLCHARKSSRSAPSLIRLGSEGDLAMRRICDPRAMEARGYAFVDYDCRPSTAYMSQGLPSFSLLPISSHTIPTYTTAALPDRTQC